jgi:hypothetical protein
MPSLNNLTSTDRRKRVQGQNTAPCESDKTGVSQQRALNEGTEAPPGLDGVSLPVDTSIASSEDAGCKVTESKRVANCMEDSLMYSSTNTLNEPPEDPNSWNDTATDLYEVAGCMLSGSRNGLMASDHTMHAQEGLTPPHIAEVGNSFCSKLRRGSLLA